MTTKLTYIGNGSAIIGVPARDLTEEEVQTLSKEFDLDMLIKSGLYKQADDFEKQDAAKVLPHIKKAKKEEGE